MLFFCAETVINPFSADQSYSVMCIYIRYSVKLSVLYNKLSNCVLYITLMCGELYCISFVAINIKTTNTIMGLCKCPKKRVTNLFCFAHKVNVCEHCMVEQHSRVSDASKSGRMVG